MLLQTPCCLKELITLCSRCVGLKAREKAEPQEEEVPAGPPEACVVFGGNAEMNCVICASVYYCVNI